MLNLDHFLAKRVDLPFSKAATDTYRFLLPRAAFFDKRVRGKYKNATVVLTHVIKTMVKLVGCIIDGHRTDKVELKAIDINSWIHKRHPECTHDNVFIFCYDTPGRNNSEVSVVYENPKNALELFTTESEHLLFVPKSRENSKTFTSSVMVCTTVYDTPMYFGAWLRYQKTLGVDFVYINAMESFLSSKVFNDTFLQNSLSSGFVQLKVWKEYLNPEALFYHSQALYYQNCVYRFQGVYDYAIMGDTDDFLIPSGGQIHQILQDIFNPNPRVGSTRLTWIRYFEPTGGFNFTEDTIADGNLTRYVNISLSKDEHNYKSIHKLSAISEVGVHLVSEQMKGYKWIRAPNNVLYMAHIKKHKPKI